MLKIIDDYDRFFTFAGQNCSSERRYQKKHGAYSYVYERGILHIFAILSQMSQVSGSINDLSCRGTRQNVTTCLVDLRPLDPHPRSRER